MLPGNCFKGWADPEEDCPEFQKSTDLVCPYCGYCLWEDED